jgi:mRNA-degrading endonuclease RelE of RelBE toxin-antitoxin system
MLEDQPAVETRKRKKLRPNHLSRWELRIRNYRIFYDVDEETRIVNVKFVGVKVHNALLIRGEETEL